MPIDIPARLVLAPVLALQALRLRAAAQVLPEARGQRSGTAGMGPRLRVLIVGDSSAAGVGAATQAEALAGRIVADLSRDHRVEWRLIARSGATALSMLEMLRADAGGRFDVAVVTLGVNDAKNGVPWALYLARMRRIVALLSGRYGAGRIYVSGLPPVGLFPVLPQPLRWILGSQVARFDRLLAYAARRIPGMVHVPPDFTLDVTDLAIDGFHAGPRLYRRWGRCLARAVRAGDAVRHAPSYDLRGAAGTAPRAWGAALSRRFRR
ncbi:SGNH/GDSL hydrolase family protein [Wenxinia saemankumensis]|uniref:Lysophospholipase L1 n=1 Tax=Wenxinia saemankumensis TaxID=1447782 RepID=A0A1M6CPD7_9RHOB|nr:SGNH/GDSL hydrolase family protein [Wenxinia saemankumensis]SHI62850.1 Lysophospholipase L1 [Wenxinia saemankumensis]